MRFSRVEFPGETPISLRPGLNILAGLDPAARRRWLDGLTGRLSSRIWVDDAETPVSDPGWSPLMVEMMVVRREDLAPAPGPMLRLSPPPDVTESGAADPTSVAAALAAWQHAFAFANRHAEEAARLAAEWERLSRTLAAEPEMAQDDQEKIEAARQNLDRALEAVARARQASGTASLSPETVAVAHRLHDELVVAQEQAFRRFAGAKARARLAAAQDEERQFLAALGVSSYTAFLLEAVDRPTTDPEVARRVQEAEKEAQEAEATWRALGALGAQARERVQLERQVEALRRRIEHLLGSEPAGDVASALRAWPAGAPELQAAREALEAELRAVGVDPGPDPASTAAEWLAAHDERHEAETQGHGEAPAPGSDPERIERYLLGRLAAQTGAGEESFPLVFDDALEGLEEPVLERALTVIQQLAASVQIIYLTADGDGSVDLTDDPAEDETATVPMVREAPVPVEPPRAVLTPPFPLERAVPEAPAMQPTARMAVAEVLAAPAAPAREVQEEAQPPATKLAWCSPGAHYTAVEACSRCRQPVCDDHVVRTRTTFPTMCPPCALEVAGVARGRRRR